MTTDKNTRHNLYLEGELKIKKVEKKDGEIELVIFVGHNAKERYEDYEKWLKHLKEKK